MWNETMVFPSFGMFLISLFKFPVCAERMGIFSPGREKSAGNACGVRSLPAKTRAGHPASADMLSFADPEHF